VKIVKIAGTQHFAEPHQLVEQSNATDTNCRMGSGFLNSVKRAVFSHHLW